MAKIKKFFKSKQNILITILSIVISIILTLRIRNDRIELSDLKTINIWLFLLVLIFVIYLFSHFIFKIKDIYNFIYKKRYILALIILIILVLGKFNGSSIGIWDDQIQPSQSFETNTIIGDNRVIRSDEWLVNTPYAISQKYNDYEYYNDLARATDTDMYSSIFVPVKDILILARPFNIGYLLFGEEYGLSIYWYGRLILLLLISFEMCMLITDKKKLPSLIGAILITGSPVVSWFYSNYIVDLLISGQLCLLMLNSLLTTKNKKLKILYSILIGFSFSWFALTIYPAWQVPLGYMYLMFAIWIVYKNFKENKHIKDYLYLLISIIYIAIMLARYLMLGMNTINIMMNTVYPGHRVVTGGGSTIFNFIYPISIFFPISNYINPCEASGVYSLFPIPILISIIYIFKNKKDKNRLLFILLTSLAIIFTIFTMVELPSIITKITLLSMVTTKRIVPIIGIICVYIIVMLLEKIKIENRKTKIIILILSILASTGIVYVGHLDNVNYLTLKKAVVATIVLITAIYTFITYNSKKNKVVFSTLMILLGLANIVLVNPVNIGTSVTHKKSAAKMIKKIVKNDKEATWASIDSITIQNYVLMNGGKVINSTNIYPNMKIWKSIDKKGKYKDIYNRYAHISMYLTTEKTEFELVQGDYFKLYLNYNDIEKLDIDYFISNDKIDIDEEYKDKFEKIYHKENIWIYKYLG